MLFSAVDFLFVFLPLTLGAFLALRRFAGVMAALGFLTLASVVFYGVWKPEYVPLLLGSVVANYGVSRLLGPGRRRNRLALAAGVAGNLGLLFWFKYASFVSVQLHAAGVLDSALAPKVLPLAISFFTFQQIAYLVDVSRGQAMRVSLLKHLLFVSFFPHLIAGPITHPATILPQLDSLEPTWTRTALGVFVFAVGLAKKVAIADPLGRFVDPSFANPEALAQVNAWAAVAAYTFQLYFDFSGYSDMAVGLGLLFGIQLPWNFYSPYKARSIAEFWRHWHVTLSDFLKNYLFIPLGGSRRGLGRTVLNLLITMLLGGIWHGAGWTFVLWGVLHGTALSINHVWRSLGVQFPRPFGRLLTLGVVLAGWVLFRSGSLDTATAIYRRMIGLEGRWMDEWDRGFNLALVYLVIAAGVAFVAPNTSQLASRFKPSLGWSLFGAALLAISMVLVLGQLKPPEFLYFEF